MLFKIISIASFKNTTKFPIAVRKRAEIMIIKNIQTIYQFVF
ncbi:hypothetical protein MTBBW1_1470007 [Desulfamplus magnetovallimortis]|uniref:Uncharacterized protein n=1 Tax=Desulfamplus magnetovallimortis TaxID=1246637 RepID=A0A1W1H8D4_9BACT|nr:hypothetical protein MTBBW1_1470007 [Desulfamplus magnetovallimortis]